MNLQLGVTEDHGHWHDDVGTWQIWRNGRWLSRETTGYSQEIVGYGGVSVDTNNFAAHNTLLVGGRGQARAYHRGPTVVSRLESRPEYAYAAVDLTDAYRATHPKLDYPAVSRVEREFLFVRPLEALIIFDRAETSESVPATFLARFETKPTFEAGRIVEAVNGKEALRITTLVPSSPVYRPLVEEGGQIGQYRVEIETAAAKQAFLLNVLQAKSESDPDLAASVVDEGAAYRVTLTHPTKGSATITLQKAMTGSRGHISVAGQSYALTEGVQPVSVTDNGPIWGTPASAPPEIPTEVSDAPDFGESTVGAQLFRVVRKLRQLSGQFARFEVQ